MRSKNVITDNASVAHRLTTTALSIAFGPVILLCSQLSIVVAGGNEPNSIVQALEASSPEQSESVRVAALYWLRDQGQGAAGAVARLSDVSADQEEPFFIRLSAINAIRAIGRAAQPAMGSLIQVSLATNEAPALRRAAVAALGSIGPAASEAIPILTSGLRAPISDPAFKRECVYALGGIGGKRALDSVRPALSDPEVQLEAVEVLASFGDLASDDLGVLSRILLETNQLPSVQFHDRVAEAFVRIAEASAVKLWSLEKLETTARLIGTTDPLLQQQGLKAFSTRIRMVQAVMRSEIELRSIRRHPAIIVVFCFVAGWICCVVCIGCYWIPASRHRPLEVAELLATIENLLRVEVKGYLLPLGQIVSLALGLAFARSFPKVRHKLLLLNKSKS